MNSHVPLTACLAVYLLPLMAASNLQAAPADAPFNHTNRSPLVGIYGLPSAQTAQLTTAGQLTGVLQIDVANNFTEHQKNNEAIMIDGETHRATLQFRYGLNQHIELGIDLPYISHEGGRVDGFIDGWHEFWGLPDGDRSKFSRNQLNYRYENHGQVLTQLKRSADGLSDISLSLAYQLSSQPQRQWALRSSVKLPTGDADFLLGSESTDIALGLMVSDQVLLQAYNIGLHASAGVMWMDDGKVLDELRKDWVAYGSTTLSWAASPTLNIKIQLDAHSAFYDSHLAELGSNSAQLILGGTLVLSKKWSLDLALGEDIAVDTAPDVVFIVAIKTTTW